MYEKDVLKEKLGCKYYNHIGMCTNMVIHIEMFYHGSRSVRFVGCEHVSYILVGTISNLFGCLALYIRGPYTVHLEARIFPTQLNVSTGS
jgi:hypothetical protein